MVLIKGTKSAARRLRHLVRCFLSLAGSGHISSAAIGGRGRGHPTVSHPVALQVVGSGVAQQWRSSWRTLPWNEQPATHQGRLRLAGVRRRGLADPRGGHVREPNMMLQGLAIIPQRKNTAGLCSGLPSAQRKARRRQTKELRVVRGAAPPPPCDRTNISATAPSSAFWVWPRSPHAPKSATTTATVVAVARRGGRTAAAEPNTLQSFKRNLGTGVLLRPRQDKAYRETRQKTRQSAQQARSRAHAPRTQGLPGHLWKVWRGLMALEGWCEASWGGRACAHVVAGALASSHSLVGSIVVGLAVWVSCAKRLGENACGKDGWKQVARITAEVAVLWYCHAMPHGLGAGRPLRGNFGSGKAGDLLGAIWHFLGQGAFIRLVAASGRLVGINVLEANGLLLGISCFGNEIAGSRMRHVVKGSAAEVCTYQLRGFFSRTDGIFGEKLILSLPFDVADTFLALQGILSATEREVVRKNGVLATAFREFASQPANTLDAHSLGALGARNLMGMGFVRARVRMFGRPALSLGWTEKASNMCLVGDPICGSLLQKILDPTCVMLKGRGHIYEAYIAGVSCLTNR